MTTDRAAQDKVEKVNSCYYGHELFRIAKYTVWQKFDVIGVNCLKMKVTW